MHRLTAATSISISLLALGGGAARANVIDDCRLATSAKIQLSACSEIITRAAYSPTDSRSPRRRALRRYRCSGRASEPVPRLEVHVCVPVSFIALGTEGWSSEAPFDAILVSAGAPDVPKSLIRQLRIGARMVVPIGSDPRSQELIRITRLADDE